MGIDSISLTQQERDLTIIHYFFAHFKPKTKTNFIEESTGLDFIALDKIPSRKHSCKSVTMLPNNSAA